MLYFLCLRHRFIALPVFLYPGKLKTPQERKNPGRVVDPQRGWEVEAACGFAGEDNSS
jgi:hypothetical protein